MSDEKYADDISFRVFDCADVNLCNEEFEMRLEHARRLIGEYKEIYPGVNVSLIEHEWCDSLEELLEIEERFLVMGYEGVMMRSPFGRYKHGRGTFKEGIIYKLKRFQDDDGVLEGIEVGENNRNADIRSNYGTAKRQTLKANMFPSDMAGNLRVRFKGEIINVAPGTLTHDERRDMLANPDKYLERDLTFRHFAHGAKDLPRQARFANWRSKIDL
jgi:DNA ligase-1